MFHGRSVKIIDGSTLHFPRTDGCPMPLLLLRPERRIALAPSLSNPPWRLGRGDSAGGREISSAVRCRACRPGKGGLGPAAVEARAVGAEATASYVRSAGGTDGSMRRNFGAEERTLRQLGTSTPMTSVRFRKVQFHCDHARYPGEPGGLSPVGQPGAGPWVPGRAAPRGLQPGGGHGARGRVGAVPGPADRRTGPTPPGCVRQR